MKARHITKYAMKYVGAIKIHVVSRTWVLSRVTVLKCRTRSRSVGGGSGVGGGGRFFTFHSAAVFFKSLSLIVELLEKRFNEVDSSQKFNILSPAALFLSPLRSDQLLPPPPPVSSYGSRSPLPFLINALNTKFNETKIMCCTKITR